MIDMRNLKIKKRCPFCPKNRSSYIFKTYHGLYRHIWRWHIIDKNGKHQWEPSQGEAAGIRIFKVKFSKFKDYKVSGKEQIDALIEAYVKGMNPSLRGIEIFEE